VSILSQPSPYVRALTAAQRAHYERHDLEAALDHARRARRYAADRAQARRAERLECDALIASGRVEEAVVACERLLDDPNPERVRMTHYALGSLLRGRLGDCARALPHLDAAVVFGHSSLYGTDARLQRADCALARGDLEQVERDLRILRQREGLRDRSREIDDLAERLSRAMGATSATGRRGRAR
jgi:tetratricopeptide (TPR) repeat protein